jgi:hypothetical protein
MISGFNAHEDNGCLQPRRSPLQRSSGPDEGVPQASPAYPWAEAFHALRGDSTDTDAQHDADRERIACLESIIATLIEKNERMRQQLITSMD